MAMLLNGSVTLKEIELYIDSSYELTKYVLGLLLPDHLMEGVCTQFPVKFIPVGFISFGVYLPATSDQLWVFGLDVFQNILFATARRLRFSSQ